MTSSGATVCAGAAAPSVLVALTCKVKSCCCVIGSLTLSPLNWATVMVTLPPVMVSTSPAVLLNCAPPGKPEIVTWLSVSGAGPLVSVSATLIDSGIGCAGWLLVASAVAVTIDGASDTWVTLNVMVREEVSNALRPSSTEKLKLARPLPARLCGEA